MIHHVFACKSNLGDWLSARGIQSLLAPLPVVEHLCDEPFVPETLAALAALTPRDLVVIGGGGLLMDYFTPFWEGFAPLAERVPFCLWGLGYCDLKHADSRAPEPLIRAVAARSRLTVVRDELTRSSLRELVGEPPLGCPSMVVLEPPAEPGFGLLHAAHYNDLGPAGYDAARAVCEAFARATGRPYAEAEHDLPTVSEAALTAALERYAAADLVVSSRLHGCIIAAALGRPVLAVAADRKVDSFMALAGLSEWVCSPSDPERLAVRLADLARERPRSDVAERARAGNRRFAERVKRLAAELAAVG